MEARIAISNEKKLIGNRIKMSLVDYKVMALWKNFMPRRKEITKTLTSDLISISVYEPAYFTNFNAVNEFEKWAAVEVSDFEDIPNGMETFILPAGLYAVFEYKGLSTDHSIYQYILGTWLPHSCYDLDDRPHFEVLGEKYKNNDPASEEEIWTPIKPKESRNIAY